jgi:hypothetical protein
MIAVRHDGSLARSTDLAAYLEAEGRLNDLNGFISTRARMQMAPHSVVHWARTAILATIATGHDQDTLAAY